MDLKEEDDGEECGGRGVYSPAFSTTRRKMRWTRVRYAETTSLTPVNATDNFTRKVDLNG